jgi:hypothetical protein
MRRVASQRQLLDAQANGGLLRVASPRRQQHQAGQAEVVEDFLVQCGGLLMVKAMHLISVFLILSRGKRLSAPRMLDFTPLFTSVASFSPASSAMRMQSLAHDVSM